MLESGLLAGLLPTCPRQESNLDLPLRGPCAGGAKVAVFAGQDQGFWRSVAIAHQAGSGAIRWDLGSGIVTAA